MRHFEGYTDGGVLHCELEDLPNVIRVRLPDKRGGNRVRSARVWDYIPKRICYNAWPMSERDEKPAMFVCSECKTWVGTRVYCHPVDPSHEKYLVLDCNVKYCPNCGAKVVE